LVHGDRKQILFRVRHLRRALEAAGMQVPPPSCN
jgi:hypothetical protein